MVEENPGNRPWQIGKSHDGEGAEDRSDNGAGQCHTWTGTFTNGLLADDIAISISWRLLPGTAAIGFQTRIWNAPINT